MRPKTKLLSARDYRVLASLCNPPLHYIPPYASPLWPKKQMTVLEYWRAIDYYCVGGIQ